jgi:hypothetical protein
MFTLSDFSLERVKYRSRFEPRQIRVAQEARWFVSLSGVTGVR